MTVTFSTGSPFVSGASVSFGGTIEWSNGDFSTVNGVTFRVYSDAGGFEYYPDPGTSWTAPGGSGDRYSHPSASATLTRGREYSVRLISSSHGSASNSYAFYVKDTQSAPSAPTMSSRTTTSITLNSQTGCEYRRGSGSWQDSTTFSGLSASTSYTFYARKKETSTHEVSPSSSGTNISTLAASPPPAPTGLVATNGNNSVSLSWNSSSGATEYVVYRDGASIATVFSTSHNDTGASAPSISASMSASTNSAAQINVSISASTSNGTLHSYTVRAGNANGYSADSSSASGRRVPGALSYQIRAGNSSSAGTHTLVSNDSTYIDTSNPPTGSAPTSVVVDNATTTSLRVSWSGAQAFNGSTRYYSSTVTATGCSNQSPTASGYRLGQISGYEIFRSTSSGSLGSSIGSGTSPTTNSGLTANTEYWYTVKLFITSIATTYNSSQAYGKTLSARPTDFTWSVAKVSGEDCVITALEWNAFTAKINSFRTYKALSTISFATAVTNNDVLATIFNAARNAIADMSPPIAPPSTVTSGGVSDVEATKLNLIVSSLNSIV